MDEQRKKLETLKARREKLVRRYCIFCLIELAIMVLTAPFPSLTTLSMVCFALLLLVMLPIILINETMKSKIKKLEASLPPKPMTPPVGIRPLVVRNMPLSTRSVPLA
jgi:Flp pilus assembly protein TadB